MSKWKGYISSRKVNNSSIPQRVQNLVIRSFCERNDKEFLLSATEYYMDNCFMILESLCSEIDFEFTGLVFYSLHMLPEKKSYREDLLNRLLENNKKVFFALENMEVTSKSDISILNDVFLTKAISNTTLTI